ncbi:MAG: class I SAM-dependent methyltransferase [Stellaceae bacterium]
MDTSRVAGYVLQDKLHRAVAGWLDEGAMSAVIAFAKWQDENNILGDVAEIGVHHGKFFILLANLRRRHERAFAIDVFEDQHLNLDKSGRGDFCRFIENLRQYGSEMGLTVLKKDSKTLTRADLYTGRKGSIRLFSIDGSHTAAHTCSDLTIAAQLIGADGVMILDDFYNPDWPGVQEGFYRYLATAATDTAPFAYGNNKLFLCKVVSHPKYLNFVENNLHPFFSHYKRVEIGSFSVVHMSLPGPELVFNSDLRFIRNIFSLRGPKISPRVEFGEGWAELQSNGVWTQGTRSEVTLKMLAPSPDPVALSIEAQPFLHHKRASRRLSVTLNGLSVGEFTFDRATPKCLRIPLPQGILHSGCDLMFEIEEPDRPSETIGTQDERQLGFFFRQIQFL